MYRGGYYHHGIDLGDGTVIHFSGEPGMKKEAVVRRSSMAEFLHNDTQYEVIGHSSKEHLDPDVVVMNAFSGLGQKGYFLPTNNCEHFSNRCKTGNSTSLQMRESAKVAFKYSRYGLMNPWLLLAGPAVDIFMRGAKYAIHTLGRGERTTPTTLRYTGTVYTDGKSNNFFLNPVGVWSRFLEQQGWVAVNNLPSPASLLPYLNQFAHTYVEEKGRMVLQAASGVFLLDGSSGWSKIA